MRLLCCMWILMAFTIAAVEAHPHDGDPQILNIRGTITKVDLVNRAIEVDTFDRATKTTRNLLLFLDGKVKVRNGKARVEVAELRPGQNITCTVERKDGAGGKERLVAFQIQIDGRT